LEGRTVPWVRLCEVDEIPVGGKKRFKVEGREVLLVRLEDGFYAVDNRCPHAGCRLSYYGQVWSRKRIMCSCHGAVFSLENGRVLEGPAEKSLKTYRVEVRGGEVFVEL